MSEFRIILILRDERMELVLLKQMMKDIMAGRLGDVMGQIEHS